MGVLRTGRRGRMRTSRYTDRAIIGNISVVHRARCATKIVKPIIGAGRGWGPPYFCGACLPGVPQKHDISVARLVWCATEIISVSHTKVVRH
jgi:hypothetical protein